MFSLRNYLLYLNSQRFLLMETLCPNESQLLEKVLACYLGKGRDQIASFTAIFNEIYIFCVFF